MEGKYVGKVHQNNIKSKSVIQTTLVFNISETYQKEISKRHQFFAFQDQIKICAPKLHHFSI